MAKAKNKTYVVAEGRTYQGRGAGAEIEANPSDARIISALDRGSLEEKKGSSTSSDSKK